MVLSRYGRSWLPAICLVILMNCAKHKLTPVAAPFPPAPAPTTNVPVAAPPAVADSKPAQTEKKVAQAKRQGPESNRLLLEPPRMSFAPDRHVQSNNTRSIDKITVLVDAGTGTLRPESEVIIQNAMRVLSDQFLFLCPDHMRVGSAEDCRFKTKEELDDFFRVQLVEQGVEASQAGAVTVVMHADLTSADKNAFDIRAVPTANSSPGEELWRVAPRNPGDHKLKLRVTPSARIMSDGEVQGEPILLDHPVSVGGADTFFNDYGPALIGCLAALGLLAWIAWTLWRHARPSVLSSR
jgi:hypothetical protein